MAIGHRVLCQLALEKHPKKVVSVVSDARFLMAHYCTPQARNQSPEKVARFRLKKRIEKSPQHASFWGSRIGNMKANFAFFPNTRKQNENITRWKPTSTSGPK